LFPPVIRGSIIVTIGLTLAPSVINSSIIDSAVGTLSQRWIIALSVVIAMTIVSVFLKGFLKTIPILFGLLVGYLVAFSFGLVDLSTLQELSFIQVPTLTLPKFNMESILLIAPVSLITLVEHIGDITTNGAITNRDYIKEVGLHRTLLGDGLASIFAGFIGAPANTSYSENSALLAMTKIYDPSILRLTAIYAIILSFFGKFTGFIAIMPSPIVGGISILFGMISTVGIRQLQKVDFGTNKNMIVVSLMLVLGLSGVTILIGEVAISGMPLAAMIGVIANQLLPDRN
jgi:uracil permease